MYPHTKDTEFVCVRWLHELWNGPKDAEPYGAATIGSSEACMLGGLAHKWNWREVRQKAGKDASRPNMVTGGNVQIVWKKFLRYFDVEPRIVPLKPGNYRLTAEHLDKYVLWRSLGRHLRVRTMTFRKFMTGLTRMKKRLASPSLCISTERPAVS